MEDIIIIVIVLAIIGGIVYYLYRSKKRGDVCVGCPHGKQCGGKCSGGCSHERPQDDAKEP